ncbi:hydroxypyruvate isomerase family protein [Rhodococcus jostii]|uniref:hydroxypyruvate isomerase family protein n=1 Tax=Rhodococcus jostii TaxID=132919 RepID=UPI00363AC233
MTYAVNCSILLTELPLLERPTAARAAGFDRVEFWWPFAEAVPNDDDVDQFIAAVRDSGVTLTGLNFAAGDMPRGDRGLLSWPGRQHEFRDNIDVVIGIGEELGCKSFNALYGNRVDGTYAQEQDELALSNLVFAANSVARIGGVVLVEPVSGAPRYPLRKAKDALNIISRLRASGIENIRLLADFYHLAVNGDDVEAVIADHAAEFGHIQIADDPGRGAPGTGALPLAEWVTSSRKLGYSGVIGLEYKAPASEAFNWVKHQSAAV